MRKTIDIAETELASYPQRIGARIIDFFLASILFGIFLEIMQVDIPQKTFEQMMKSTDPTMGLGKWIFFLPLIFIAYEVPLLSAKGVTIGKKMMGICVVRTDGLIGIGLDRALLRVVVPLIVALIPVINFFYLIGQFWFFIDPKRQNIPDKIARTYVIRTPSGLFSSISTNSDLGE